MDHEPQWESLVGSQNSLKAQSIDDDNESTQNDTDDLLMKSDDTTDKSYKGYSKYRARQLSFPPPTLNTQLPFKLEEEENDEDDSSSNKSSTETNSVEVIK